MSGHRRQKASELAGYADMPLSLIHILLVEIAFLPTLHLAVLATVIRERFIGCAICLSFGAFVAVHSSTANGALDKGG